MESCVITWKIYLPTTPCSSTRYAPFSRYIIPTTSTHTRTLAFTHTHLTHSHTHSLHSPQRVPFLPSGFWQRDQLLWLRLGAVDRKRCRNFGFPALQALQKQCPSLFKNHWSVENPGDQTKESLAPHAVFGREWLIPRAHSDLSSACSV